MNPDTRSIGESAAARGLLVGAAVVVVGLFLVLPLVTVFGEALVDGIAAYVEALHEENARAAMFLTLTVAAIAVPLNTVFGLAAVAFKPKPLTP